MYSITVPKPASQVEVDLIGSLDPYDHAQFLRRLSPSITVTRLIRE